MLVRLVYKSILTGDIDEASLREIARRASSNNSARNVTGCLLQWDREFLQALEGEAGDVNDIYLKIASDERHTGVQLMAYNRVDSRLFSDWNMISVHFDSLPDEARRQLEAKYSADERSLRIPEEPEAALALVRDLHFFRCSA